MEQLNIKRWPIERIDIAINMEATGANIGRLIKACGYTVEDIRIITGLGSKQAVYKWLRGESIPGPENQMILSRVLGVGMNDILVFDGDFDFARLWATKNASYLGPKKTDFDYFL